MLHIWTQIQLNAHIYIHTLFIWTYLSKTHITTIYSLAKVKKKINNIEFFRNRLKIWILLLWSFKSLNFVVSCERKPQAIAKWKYHSKQYFEADNANYEWMWPNCFCNPEEKILGWEQCNEKYNQKAN